MIHQYKLGGYHVVLDVCSGSVHVVDEVAYDIIGAFEEHTKEEILAMLAEKYPQLAVQDMEECYEQVEELRDAGK